MRLCACTSKAAAKDKPVMINTNTITVQKNVTIVLCIDMFRQLRVCPCEISVCGHMTARVSVRRWSTASQRRSSLLRHAACMLFTASRSQLVCRDPKKRMSVLIERPMPNANNKKGNINGICKLLNFDMLSKTKPHAQVTHLLVFLASDVVFISEFSMTFYYVCILLGLLFVSDKNVVSSNAVWSWIYSGGQNY